MGRASSGESGPLPFAVLRSTTITVPFSAGNIQTLPFPSLTRYSPTAEDMIRPRPALLFQDSDDEPSRDVPASSSDSPLAEARLGKTRAYYRCEGL